MTCVVDVEVMFPLYTCSVQLPIIGLRAGTLDLIKEIKVSRKTLKKVTSLNNKWQVI